MIYLVTVMELDLNIPLAFVVAAPTRAQAKVQVKRYCTEYHLSISASIHTHDISEGAVTRIDHLLLSGPSELERGEE